MDKETVISVENVSKKYCKSLKKSMHYGAIDIARNILGMSSKSSRLRKDEFWALNDISFEVRKGETLGIIGPNGSGKTTLLKLLNGIFWPDKGKITIRGKTGALIELGAGFHPHLTGRENIYINAAILGMTKKEVVNKFDAIVEFAGISDFIDAPVKHYSSGMYVRLGFSVAVHSQADILLIDEVLAIGDVGFQNRCFNKIGELKQEGTTTILVSHNMHIISTFVEKIILLNHAKAISFNCVTDGIKEYAQLFTSKDDSEIERVSSGNDSIRFYAVEIKKRIFNPGDSFTIVLKYQSELNYEDVDVDIAIFNSYEPVLYFQATNKAYGRNIDLPKGDHSLEIKIIDIRLNSAMARIAIAIWSKRRRVLLFWWRIPVTFEGVDYSTGRNFLNVTYELSE
jgi:lipopolysaccharide transport system ATP-binding protein